MSDVVGAIEAAFVDGLERCAAEYPAAFERALGERIDQAEHALRAVNARYAGPSGELTALMKRMPELPSDRRRDLGQRANKLKLEIQEAFQARLAALATRAREQELSGPHLDVSLPGRGHPAGRLHPLTRVKHELLDVFSSMGFDIADGPEVDLYEHNFDRLGFPPDHPATDMQDTFFVSVDSAVAPELVVNSAVAPELPSGSRNAAALKGARPVVLRTHTSTVQVREMMRRPPPLAVVSAGATFRRDDDATHSPMFMQIEGFLVDRGVSFANLKGVLTHFLRRVFGQDVPVRFRPSYFPFVEPGGEVDVGCTLCRRWDPKVNAALTREDPRGNQYCRVCKNTGFIEILGCGMIHPVVFEHVGYDAEQFTGFAFGMGIDRVAMLRYGVPHLNLMYGNDPRFLTQL